MNTEKEMQDNHEIKETENSTDIQNDDKSTIVNENNISNEEANEDGNGSKSEVSGLQKLEEELVETKDKLLRTLAENENTRKQMEKIRQESVKYGVQPLARDILSVVDNFDRALSTKNNDGEKALEEGVVLIKKEILDILDKFGVKKMDALGESFNANFHQAMFEKETEKHEPGVVCEIVQEGYKFHDRLLRPVLVGVAKKSLEKNQELNIEEKEENSEKE